MYSVSDGMVPACFLSYTAETALPHSEALEILKVVKESQESPSVTSLGKSALDLLRNEVEYGSVVTFSSQVRNGVRMQTYSLQVEFCHITSGLALFPGWIHSVDIATAQVLFYSHSSYTVQDWRVLIVCLLLLQVDSMLGGGVPVGKITELCGAPGVGKTQFR